MYVIKDYRDYKETTRILEAIGLKFHHDATSAPNRWRAPRGAYGTLEQYHGRYGDGVVIITRKLRGGLSIAYYLYRSDRTPRLRRRDNGRGASFY